MTRRELELRMKMLEAKSKVLVMQQAPVRTGNLMRSIKTSSLPNGGFRIYIDETKSPYAKYTENTWSKGTNPNQGWFTEAGYIVARNIAANLKSNIR